MARLTRSKVSWLCFFFSSQETFAALTNTADPLPRRAQTPSRLRRNQKVIGLWLGGKGLRTLEIARYWYGLETLYRIGDHACCAHLNFDKLAG